MARFYSSTFNGNGTAQYQIIMDVTENSAATSANASGTITVYLYAVKDVVNGYNFSYGNSLVVKVGSTTLLNSSNVGTVKCQSTGTTTQIWTGTWSSAKGATSLTISAAFKQTQDTRYAGTATGTITLPAKPTVYVYNGSAWKSGVAWDYNGSAWKISTKTYVHNGSTWKS